MKQKTSPFTILTIFICLSIIGTSLIPLLNIQLKPTLANKSLTVNFNWTEASARVVEQEATSKLEGLFNLVRGVQGISSTSYKGGGSVSIHFKKNVDMDLVRFEVANLIRQCYPSLPEGVSYPSLSRGGANENSSPMMSYSINANESPYFIKKYVESQLLPKLSVIKGVNKVGVYGAAPYEWVINYSSDKLFQLQISVSELQGAINSYLQKRELGNAFIRSENQSSDNEISLVLAYRPHGNVDWNHIPIKKINNRTLYLKDIATVRYKEGKVSSYYRINGLNTVNMVVYAEKGINTISLAKTVRQAVDGFRRQLSPGYSIKMTQDTTEFIVSELNKIQKRTLFSLLILLLLILFINRSLKYLMILFLSIIANLLIAVIFYYALEVQLQLYSFAGITISFGIIIDNSIVMIDHLRNKGNKKSFLAILAATLTTIGALVVILFLEESQRLNLWDFAVVIAVNIGVSLFVSLYFVPALLEKIKLDKTYTRLSVKRKRRIVKFTNVYARIILWGTKPKFKWAFIVLFILGFGLPLHLLPKELKTENFGAKLYNDTLGSEWYNTELRPILEKVLGGSLRLFTENVFENSYYSEPERTSLRVTGSMPDGCTTEQLNEVITKMENYIGQFEEVSLYETRISSPKSSNITIYFKDAYEYGSFPFTLKSMLESKSISLGGLDWTVSGVGRGFSNALGNDYKNNHIVIEGYNYDNLYAYAELLKQQLETNSNGRVKDVEITAGRRGVSPLNEYYLSFNDEQLALANVSQNQLYGFLKKKAHYGNIASVIQEHERQRIRLVSDTYQKFTVWDLKNLPILVNNKQYKLEQLASVEKRKSGNTIYKNNQQYRLIVAYDFLGAYPLAQKVRERNVKALRDNLPIGYRVLEQSYNYWNKKDSKQYYYIFIVIFIIFLICSILLESLRQPLAIISMIPLSFIGVFLTFYLFDFNFDQGGYASFILLCAISVNSALFIINDYNNLRKQYPKKNIQQVYFKAFNYKIIPVILTIASTIVGLLPFVWHGQNEVFWFSFAVGAIGGLLFSIVGVYFYLPLFCILPKKRA